MGIGKEAGVRDGGGAGGGKGCNKGAPYGRCRLTAGWRRGAVGTDEETRGIDVGEEERGTKNEDGFTRLLTSLVLLWDSGMSRKGAKVAGDICMLGIGEGATPTGCVEEDW